MDAAFSFNVSVGRGAWAGAVVVEVSDQDDHAFTDAQAVTWADLDALGQQYGVPPGRWFVDADARALLDAA